MLALKERTTSAERRELVREEQAAAPKRVFPTRPAKGHVNYGAIRKKIVARFTKTLAYLAR
jgi:hypothetical protein